MRLKSFIVMLIGILTVLFIFPAIYLMTLSPKDITPKDLKPILDRSGSFINHSDSNQPYQGKKTEFSDNHFEFYVIIGSFKNPDQAKQKASKLKQNTIEEILLLEPTQDGYTRISYGKYSTREEAELVCGKVKEAINPQAWILKVEK